MELNVSIKNVFSEKGSTNIFISKEVVSEIQIALTDIKSVGTTKIYLDQFFDEFDVCQELNLKKKNLQLQLNINKDNEEKIQQLRRELFNIRSHEKNIRIKILELALVLENGIDTEKTMQVRDTFKLGKLSNIDFIIPDEYLIKNLDEYVNNEKQLAEVSDRLIENSFEFFVKAYFTSLKYELQNRVEKTIYYFDTGMISARASENQAHIASSLFEFGTFLLDHNEFIKAESVLMDAVTIEEILAKEDPQTHYTNRVRILNLLGILFNTTNQISSAEFCFEAAITTYEEVPIKEKGIIADVGNSYNSLGSLHLDNNNFNKAEENFGHAKYIFEELEKYYPGEYIHAVISLKNSFGLMYNNMKEFAKAFDNFHEVLEYRRKEIDYANLPKVNMLASVLNNLAVLSSDTGEYHKAKSYYEENLQLTRLLVSKNREQFLPDLGSALYNYGQFMCQLESTREDAYNLLLESADIFKELTQISPSAYAVMVTTVIKSIGSLMQDNEELETAREFYLEAFEYLKKYAGQDTIEVMHEYAHLMWTMGGVYRMLDDLDIAEKMYVEALYIYNEWLPAHNDETGYEAAISIQSILSKVLIAKGEFERAKRVIQDGLDICNRIESNDSISLDKADLLSTLGEIFTEKADYNSAIKYHLNALTTLQSEGGSDSLVLVARELYFLTELYEITEQVEITIDTCKEILILVRKISSTLPEFLIPLIFNTQDRLAQIYRELNRLVDAEALLMESLERVDIFLDQHSVDYFDSKATYLGNLGVMQKDLDKSLLAEQSFIEALKLKRTLVQINPEVYTPTLIKSLGNLGAFYQDTKPELNHSILYLTEAIELATNHLENSDVQIYLNEFGFMLQQWNIDIYSYLKSHHTKYSNVLLNYMI
jgi:tetratricopeptide (TPR) repeat protein